MLYSTDAENRLTKFTKLYLTDQQKEQVNTAIALGPCIGECAFDQRIQSWKLLKLRSDKLNPNFIGVAERIWQSI